MASSIVRYDPFEELTRLQRDMNRLFDENYRAPVRTNGDAVTMRAWAPLVDVREDETDVIVHAELPGVKLEDIDIEVTGDMLTLRGERKWEDADKKNNYIRVERAYGAFQRSFSIGVAIENDKVTANFRDGVLTICLPKSAAVRPKKIAVSTSS